MSINQNKSAKNLYFMRLALSQAQKNLGNTNENPSVGCIITKEDNVISADSTALGGIPHAEHKAIQNSKKDIKGARLYVTLEPCSHYGKTQPCTDFIIKNKIREVCYALTDLDIRSKDKSKNILNSRNILVNKDICLKEAKIFYRSYIKSHSSLLPFVTCKIAVSKDYYTINKKNKWITNEFSRARAHLIRSKHECIISSYKTILSDNSRLTCRIPGLEKRSPSRIILDKNLNISLTSNIIKESKNYQTIIFYNKINKKKIQLLRNKKVKLIRLSTYVNKNFNLKEVLVKVKTLGFKRVLIEAGLNLTSSFLNDNLVDDFNLFVSNKNLGKNGKNNIKKNLNLFLKNVDFFTEKVNLFGEKLLIYRLK